MRGELHPEVVSDSGDVCFTNKEGDCVLTYAGLKVWDADGLMLEAAFATEEEILRLTVEEAGARYPLTIDPIAQEAFLKASNSTEGGRFGMEVAVSEDENTIVVGAHFEDTDL